MVEALRKFHTVVVVYQTKPQWQCIIKKYTLHIILYKCPINVDLNSQYKNIGK